MSADLALLRVGRRLGRYVGVGGGKVREAENGVLGVKAGDLVEHVGDGGRFGDGESGFEAGSGSWREEGRQRRGEASENIKA
jgi:hypothetical protein